MKKLHLLQAIALSLVLSSLFVVVNVYAEENNPNAPLAGVQQAGAQIAALQQDVPKYSAKIPILDQSIAERDKAFPEALKQVLIKISGKSEIVNDAKIKKTLKNASSIVKSFSYVSGLDNNQKPVLFMQINFYVRSIDKILEENPKYDIDQSADDTEIKSSKKMTGNEGQSLGASEMESSKQTDAEQIGNPKLPNAQLENVTVNIIGVSKLEQNIEIRKYLKTFSVISKAELENINGDEESIQLNLQVAGGQEALINALKNQKKLLPVDAGLNLEGTESTLNYRWNDGMR